MTLRNSPGCHGRCCGGDDCTDCCTGGLPDVLRITISGITGNECCTDLNGTYDIANTGNCTWGSFSPIVSIVLIKSGDTCTMTLFVQKFSCSAGVFNFLGGTLSFSPGDCCELDETAAISSYSGPDSCDISSATFRVQGVCLVACDECDNSEGPEEFQLDSSSWGDGLSCSDCNEVLNGTFTLTRADQACTWISNYFTFCGDSLTHWTLAIGVGQVLVSLRNGIGTVLWQWSWTHDGDCLNWTTVALTHSYTNLIYADYCYAVGALDITSL